MLTTELLSRRSENFSRSGREIKVLSRLMILLLSITMKYRSQNAVDKKSLGTTTHVKYVIAR